MGFISPASALFSSRQSARIVKFTCTDNSQPLCKYYALKQQYIYYVTSLADTNTKGTLRYGITQCNNTGFNVSGFFVIRFSVLGKIILQSDLPDIKVPIYFKGSNQREPYNAFLNGGQYNIEIGLNNYSGLNIKADYCTIKGFNILGSQDNGINIYNSNTRIEGCNINNNNGNGIYIAATSSSNIIGTNHGLDSNHISNIITQNLLNGIEIDGSNHNIIRKNYIGTIDGTNPASNQQNGIYITHGAKNNIIGGRAFKNSNGDVNNPTGSYLETTPVYIIPPQGNLISGNIENGILIDGGSVDNILYGNFIGTNSAGMDSLPNMLDGVLIQNAANNSIIGCEVYNNPFVFYNVISGNTGNGIQIQNSHDCTIQGNFIGLNMNNQSVSPNMLDGLLVSGTSTNVVDGGIIPLGNTISGNGQNGVHVIGTALNFLSFNTFSGLYAFGGAAPNGQNGILIEGDAKKATIRTTVCSGNIESGIALSGNSSYSTIESVICGSSSDYSTPVPNKYGLTITGNSNNNNVDKTDSVIRKSTFSGNTQHGIQLLGDSNNNNFFGDLVGVVYVQKTASSVVAMPNGGNGVFLDGTTNNNIITTKSVISGNDDFGVYFNNITVVNNTITGNFIGTNETLQPIPNGSGSFGGTIDPSNTITPNP